ncbi:MAG: hypothetical protein ACI8UO_006488 [Verrucomicrobiales bacterium]|jgi:hypothetical protein
MIFQILPDTSGKGRGAEPRKAASDCISAIFPIFRVLGKRSTGLPDFSRSFQISGSVAGSAGVPAPRGRGRRQDSRLPGQSPQKLSFRCRNAD